jgi:hypothetical protein
MPGFFIVVENIAAEAAPADRAFRRSGFSRDAFRLAYIKEAA